MSIETALQDVDRSGWNAFALSLCHSTPDLHRVRKWMDENLAGEYHAEVMKEIVGTRRVTVCLFVRIKEADDALLFKLRWVQLE